MARFLLKSGIRTGHRCLGKFSRFASSVIASTLTTSPVAVLTTVSVLINVWAPAWVVVVVYHITIGRIKTGCWCRSSVGSCGYHGSISDATVLTLIGSAQDFPHALVIKYNVNPRVDATVSISNEHYASRHHDI